jgi:hypothetical protein
MKKQLLATQENTNQQYNETIDNTMKKQLTMWWSDHEQRKEHYLTT